MAAYTIETWLRGMVDFEIPDATLMAIVFNNEVASGSPVASISEKERDLCLADLLVWLSCSSTVSSAGSDSDGGWKHTDSVKNVHNRSALASRAKTLYEKWNSPKASEVSVSRITFKTIR